MIAKPTDTRDVRTVSRLVRRAMYDRDPIRRAEAGAELRAMHLPVSPEAIEIAAVGNSLFDVPDEAW